jgi:hypothetical protein
MHTYTCVKISRQVYIIMVICTPRFADLHLGVDGLGGECADSKLDHVAPLLEALPLS